MAILMYVCKLEQDIFKRFELSLVPTVSEKGMVTGKSHRVIRLLRKTPNTVNNREKGKEGGRMRYKEGS